MGQPILYQPAKGRLVRLRIVQGVGEVFGIVESADSDILAGPLAQSRGISKDPRCRGKVYGLPAPLALKFEPDPDGVRPRLDARMDFGRRRLGRPLILPICSIIRL